MAGRGPLEFCWNPPLCLKQAKALAGGGMFGKGDSNMGKAIHSVATRNSAKAGFAGRRGSGQALIEGGVAMIMIGAIAIPLLIMLINVGMFMSWKSKYDFVATETARYIDANRYWMGMKRHDFNQANVEKNALALAQKLCQQLGLPPIGDGGLKLVPEEVTEILDSKVTVTRVELDPKVALSFSGLIPKPLRVMGVGVSSDASQAVPAYCTAVIAISCPNQPNNCLAVEVPAYYPMRLNAVDPDGQGFTPFTSPTVAKPGAWSGKRTRVYIGANCTDPIYPANPMGSQVVGTNGAPHSFNQIGVQ